MINGMNTEIRKGRYHHFKDATKTYTILGVAMHTETEEILVIYQAQYGEKKIFARPIDMFLGDVDKPEYKGPRFIYLGE